MTAKDLIRKIVIIGTIIESVSLGTEKSFSTYEFSEASLERIAEEAQAFKLSRIENTGINKCLDEAYKKLSLPHYINKKFIKSVINAESNKYIHAVSPAGARGLMQLTQDAWGEVEKEKNFFEYSFDPQSNIETGIRYMLYLDRYLKNNHLNWEELSQKEKRKLLSAAYNGGIKRLERREWSIEHMPSETKKYVEKVYTE